MTNRIGFTGKETVCKSWAKMALTVIQLSDSHNDWTRFLPFCNGWNLDYPEKDEFQTDYRARMIDIAIGLQLI